jgi:hypothetical protein
MEGFDLTFARGRKPGFAAAPAAHHRRLFGVDYLHLKGRQNGDLFITPHGWPIAGALLPDQWFGGQQFCKPGRALAGATGAVYRVPVPHPARRNYTLVVKFSRFGQDAGDMATAWDGGLPAALREDFVGTDFLPPFEEFGNLARLRTQARGRFATQVPLAIYSPPTRYLAWQMGRKSHLEARYNQRMRREQAGTPEPVVTYDWERLYILLYGWLEGVDAEEAARHGVVNADQMTALTHESGQELTRLGWVVLDHKPRHVILRPLGRGFEVLRRQGRPWYGLIDYELLYPLPTVAAPFTPTAK